MPQKMIFNNIAQIYLEGNRALQPVEWEKNNHVTYYLGDMTSNILINDHRSSPNFSAREAIAGENGEAFSESFSQPANVLIHSMGRDIQIDLNEPAVDISEFPVLWMGVFEGDMLAANPLDWYILRELQDERTAFVALVSPQS